MIPLSPLYLYVYELVIAKSNTRYTLWSCGTTAQRQFKLTGYTLLVHRVKRIGEQR